MPSRTGAPIVQCASIATVAKMQPLSSTSSLFSGNAAITQDRTSSSRSPTPAVQHLPRHAVLSSHERHSSSGRNRMELDRQQDSRKDTNFEEYPVLGSSKQRGRHPKQPLLPVTASVKPKIPGATAIAKDSTNSGSSMSSASPPPSQQQRFAALEEKNVRKAITRFGTMPKGARIDAYLDSLK